MPNHAGALQGRFFPAKLETEGDDAIFNTLLERYYGFAARESKNLQFLNGALEQEVLAHAFRLLTRRSKAEQNAVLRAIGLGNDDVT